jgi:hypothetical protein
VQLLRTYKPGCFRKRVLHRIFLPGVALDGHAEALATDARAARFRAAATPRHTR